MSDEQRNDFTARDLQVGATVVFLDDGTFNPGGSMPTRDAPQVCTGMVNGEVVVQDGGEWVPVSVDRPEPFRPKMVFVAVANIVKVAVRGL